MAVRSAQLSKKRELIIFLILTIVFGSMFLGVKAYEYHEKYVEHLIPGLDFQYPHAQYLRNAQILFFLYFAI